MTKHITFLRHAESIGNVAARERGATAHADKSLVDCPLSMRGIAQAREARERGLGPYAAVWCSPALRCRQTLLEVFPESVSWPVRLDWRLAEGRGWAVFNEINLVESELPAAWIRPPEGPVDPRKERETEGDVDRRVSQWWRSLQKEGLPDGDILVVTHRYPVALWIATFIDEDYAPVNCEFVSYPLPF